MEYHKIILINESLIALILLSVGFSFTVTKNSHNLLKKQNKIVETTTYSLKIGPELTKSKDA